MRYWGFLLAAFLAGCASSGSKVQLTEGEDFFRFHHVGIPSFADSKGQGSKIADSLAKALETQLTNEPVDRKALEQVLTKYKVDSRNGLSVEALEFMRVHADADAVIFGKMAPNWAAARITMVETEMGTEVLVALVKPHHGKKAFTDSEDVTREIMRTFSKLH